MEHLQRLIDFVSNANGLFAVVVGILWVAMAVRFPIARWLLFGMTMYAASVQKYFDRWTQEWWPPFWGPIELVVSNGRPICIVLLGALLLLVAVKTKSELETRVSPLMAPIHAIQIAIFFKMLLFGTSLTLTVQAGVIFVFIGCFAATGLRLWAFEQRKLEMVAFSLTATLAVFAVISQFQLQVNPAPAMVAGRLMGTTANPQHAAVLLAIGLLGPAYFISTWRQRSLLLAVASFVLMCIACRLIFLTGSRTGLSMAAIGIVILWRRKFGIGVLVGLALTFGLVYLMQNNEQEVFSSRIVTMEDTRSEVWAIQWRTFLQNPFIGSERMGDQFRSGENSWLGLLAGTGMLGGAALIWLLVRGVAVSKELLKHSHWEQHKDEVDFCLAGIFAVFAGSFFEAYLVGVITMPVLFIAVLSVACEVTLERCRHQDLRFRMGESF